MKHINNTLLLVLGLLMVSVTANAATTFRIDNFNVARNGNPFFEDPFDDGLPPPSAPDLLTGTNTAIGYFVSGIFIESNGKVELNVDNGADTFTPAGRPARIHQARLLTSTNPASPRNLGPDDTFIVSGVFDLIFPGPLTESIDVSLSDRTQFQGPGDTTNDVVRVGLVRSGRNVPTCRDPFTLLPVGAGRGELIMRLNSLDFALDTTTRLDCFKIDLSGNPDQIRLTVAKLNAASSEITGSFTYLRQGVELSTTTFLDTDTIFTGGALPDGTPFPAEQHTRPQFEAIFIPGTPVPSLVAQLTTDGPVTLTQTVDTPSTPFTLQFDYQFMTTTGNLTVSLGGLELGAIPAPAGLDPNFQTFDVLVDDPALLGQTGLPLQFLLEGVTGSTLFLDNIIFPGLINGDFQTGNLTVWNTGGTGTVGTALVASPVAVDIHPGSCPNPLNANKGGRLPAAILGSPDLDVTNIDLTTIRLAGVGLVDTFIEDVSTPFVPFTRKQSAFDCNSLGPDGFNDLTVRFDAQQVVAAIGPVSDGDVLVLSLTAELFDGTPIRGEDVVVINKKK